VEQDHEITDAELAEIVRRKRKDIKAYRQQELKPDTPLDRQATVTESTKLGTKQAKKDKKARTKESNHWEGPGKDYTKIPNEFIEAVYKGSFTRNENKVFWFMLRKTWGWKKRSEFIPLKQFEKELDILKPHISRDLSSLVKRRIVTKIGNKRYAIQSDTSLWQDKLRKTRVKLRKSKS